jgi:hypothetical protein
MSFFYTYSEGRIPIAIIEKPKADNKIIFLDTKDDKGLKDIELKDNSILQAVPYVHKTERVFISGQTECGKSYWMKNYMNQLRRMDEKKNIYLFSDVQEDEEIDKIKKLTRVVIDDNVIDNIPDPLNFKNSICIFDDYDSIQNKKILDVIQNFRDALLKRGRHENITLLISSHLSNDYKNTRIIMNECNKIVIFPKAGNVYALKYLLNKYIGMDKKQIQKLMSLPSRWVMIHKNYPQYIIYEKGIYIL